MRLHNTLLTFCVLNSFPLLGLTYSNGTILHHIVNSEILPLFSQHKNSMYLQQCDFHRGNKMPLHSRPAVFSSVVLVLCQAYAQSCILNATFKNKSLMNLANTSNAQNSKRQCLRDFFRSRFKSLEGRHTHTARPTTISWIFFQPGFWMEPSCKSLCICWTGAILFKVLHSNLLVITRCMRMDPDGEKLTDVLCSHQTRS